MAESKTLGSNLHHRAAVHFEDVVHSVALGMVGAAGHRDLGEQTVLLLIATANSLQSARNAIRDDRIAGMQLGNLLDLFLGIAGVPFQSDLSDYGTRPGDDMEGHVDLVLLLVALFRDRHFRLVESVFFHHSLDASHSAV